MYYIDTNVLLSYIFESDRNHRNAVDILSRLKEEKIYISPLTILEIYSNSCRMLRGGGKPLRKIERYVDMIQDPEDRCRVLAETILEYMRQDFRFIAIDDKWGSIDLQIGSINVKMFEPYKRAMELSLKIPIKVTDLLHLVYANELLRAGFVKYFITFDKEHIARNRSLIKNILQLEILTNDA